MKLKLATTLLLLLSACSKPDSAITTIAPQNLENARELRSAMQQIEPFFERMRPPEQYDWLGSHRESGQTFEEYLESNPTKPTSERQNIYVLPLGKFTAEQKNIINVTSAYLEAFYDLPVTLMSSRILIRPVKNDDIRRNAVTKVEQLRTGYIMDEILKPILPADAAALIAFTDVDLFPDSTMYFVFGQASLSDRVGVWSLKRLGDKAAHTTFLRRTLKIATHETGHMFSFMHCTKYECVMSGTNYLGETDRRPIDACPECMAKVCWMSDVSPSERYGKLAAFCRRNDLKKEAEEFEKKLTAIKHE